MQNQPQQTNIIEIWEAENEQDKRCLVKYGNELQPKELGWWREKSIGAAGEHVCRRHERSSGDNMSDSECVSGYEEHLIVISKHVYLLH